MKQAPQEMRDALGEERIEALVAEGEALTLEAAVELALEPVDASTVGEGD